MNQTDKLIERILDCVNGIRVVSSYSCGQTTDYMAGWNNAIDCAKKIIKSEINAWGNDQENMINRDYEAEIDTLKQKLEEFAYQNNISHSALAKKEKRIKEMSGVISAIKILADIEFESIKGDY